MTKTKKNGRPRKKRSELRRHLVGTRLTDEELRVVKSRLKKSETISTYIRSHLFGAA
jgi:hypothetical protein